MGFFLGIFGFLLCYIYDFNTVLWQKKWLHTFFFTGNLMIVAGTVYTLIQSVPYVRINALFFISLVLAAVFLVLLIYTLFFAIPFSTTYIKENTIRHAYTDGVYALSRHPAVLWFAGLYFFLWLAFQTLEIAIIFLIYVLMDILYIILQERFTFLKTFDNYREYQKSTPFLIPTFRSIKRCITHIHKTNINV